MAAEIIIPLVAWAGAETGLCVQALSGMHLIDHVGDYDTWTEHGVAKIVFERIEKDAISAVVGLDQHLVLLTQEDGRHSLSGLSTGYYWDQEHIKSDCVTLLHGLIPILVK